jgi:alpha-L-fucosidase 2
VRGLRARGGIEVDVAWRNGRAVSATLKPSLSGAVKVRVQRAAHVRDIQLVAGRPHTPTLP